MLEADVIVVGAGAAGLQAADVLSAAGKTVLIIEGRNRIGGRVETMHDPSWPLPIERGAEFIHGKPRETWDILHASGCPAYDISDTHHVFTRGKLQKRENYFDEVEKVLGVVDKVKGDMSFEEALAKFSRNKPESQAWARNFVEGFDAADTRVVSCRWLKASQKASDEIEGGRLARIYDGYDRLVNFLRTGVPEAGQRIRLSTTVTAIRWGGREVTVEAVDAYGERVAAMANKVLVTVPVGVLQLGAGETGHIEFDPPLPEKKREAIGLLKMGPIVKVLLRCKEAFWEKIDPDLNFFHMAGGTARGERVYFPTWWTSLPIRTSILTGWCGGPAAAEVSGKAPAEILSIAQKTLARMLDVSASKLAKQVIAAHVGDWQSEPLSRGAYSYAAVGGVEAAGELARPVEGRLFFAGEATHPGLTGTVAAALASAHRAAKEMMKR